MPMILCVNAGKADMSGASQYASAACVSSECIQTASCSRPALPRARAHSARPAHALTASALDSWLLPSANGDVPDAQECDAYASNVRRAGKKPVSTGDAMSAANRSITGASFPASAESSAHITPAAYRKLSLIHISEPT